MAFAGGQHLDPEAGKDWEQAEKEATGDERVGWHHQLNGCELEQTAGDSEGQGSLACCRPLGRKGLDMTVTQWLSDWTTTLRLANSWYGLCLLNILLCFQTAEVCKWVCGGCVCVCVCVRARARVCFYVREGERDKIRETERDCDHNNES